MTDDYVSVQVRKGALTMINVTPAGQVHRVEMEPHALDPLMPMSLALTYSMEPALRQLRFLRQEP